MTRFSKGLVTSALRNQDGTLGHRKPCSFNRLPTIKSYVALVLRLYPV